MDLIRPTFLLFGFAVAINAADFFWDETPHLDGNQHGSGIWSSTSLLNQWTPTASLSGSVNGPWVNAVDSVARIGAAAGYSNPAAGGTLTLGETLTLNRLHLGVGAGAYLIAPGAGPFALTFDGVSPSLINDSSSALTIQAALQSGSVITQSGVGRVILNAPAGLSNVAGIAVVQGTLELAAVNTLPASATLVLGANTTAGALDVQASQTLAGLSFQSRSAAVTNQVRIASGSTLTINGAVVTGIIDGTATGGSTLANISGGGTLAVNHPTGSFIVSSGLKPSGSATDIATLNLGDLAAFEATVNRFDVGRSTNATGVFQNSARPQATLTLARANTITAATLVVGSNAQVTTNNLLNLGASNQLNVGHWVLGVGRANGTVQFTGGLSQPTLVLRGQAGGSSRADITLGDSRNLSGTGAVGGSSIPIGTMNLSGGIVDLLVDTMVVGVGGTENGGFAGGAYGRGEGFFTFDQAGSVVDVNTLIIGRAASSNLVAENSPDPVLSTVGVFTMNGGSLQVNTAMVVGQNSDAIAGNQQNVQATFNLNQGQAVVSAPILLGQHTSTGTGIITSTLNLNGGSLSVGGAITRGSALTVGQLNLNGTALDLNGHAIGDAINPVSLNLQSGQLANVSEFNGGADFIKTGAGTLILSGANTFAGQTLINAGRLLVSSENALQNTSGVVVAGGAAFDFATGSGGSLTLPVTSGTALTLSNGSSIGAELGSLTGSIVIPAGATVVTDVSAAIGVNLYRIGTGAPPASSILLSAPGGGITATGAAYSLGVVYGATDFTASLSATDTQISVTTAAATPLSAAYWKGGFAGANSIWAASNGSTASNWVTNADGTGDTGLVPGATTDVTFSATGATLPASTTLGADMTFNSLTILTTASLTLQADGHTLSLLGAGPLVVGAAAGAVVLNTDLVLDASTPILNIDNANGVTLGGSLLAANAVEITKMGDGTLFLTGPASQHNAQTSILGGAIAISSESALGANPASLATDHLFLNGGTLRALDSFRIDDSHRGITLGALGGTFQVDGSATLGIDNPITGAGSLNKTGSGTLEITTNATYTGSTLINGGTLAVKGVNNTLSSAALIFGPNSSQLDLGGTSQTVSSLQFVTDTAAMTHGLRNGSLTVNNTATVTNFTSLPSPNVNNSTAVVPHLVVDMSDLTGFQLNATGQIVRIGLASGAMGSHTSSVNAVTVRLAETSTLTGLALRMGEVTANGGGGMSTLVLGQTNQLNFNTINLAYARSSAVMRFAEGATNPSVTIRAQNGTSAVTTWDMGALDNFSNNLWVATADFSGGSLDALVTTLNVGRVANRFGTLNASFVMDRGLLTVTNLNLGGAAGTNTGAPTSVRVVNSQFTLAGPGTVNATNLVLAANTSLAETGTSTANATLTVRDGVLNIGAGGIAMGRADVAGHTSNATLQFFGGTVNVSGNIAKHATGSGTAAATIQLAGATLNLNGNSIGTAARPIDNLQLVRGTLQNVSQINGGGAITKSGTAGDLLILAGSNSYTGATTVSGGALLVNGSHTGGGDYTVQNGALLGGSGSVALAPNANIDIAAGGTLQAGSGDGLAQTLALTTSGTGAINFADDSSLILLRILADPGAGGIDHSSDPTVADLLHVTGNINLNGATLTVFDPFSLGAGFSPGDVWRLFNWVGVAPDFGTGSNTFGEIELPTLSSGLFWDTTDLYTGGTIAVMIPEPGRVALIALGLITFGLRRRRSVVG